MRTESTVAAQPARLLAAGVLSIVMIAVLVGVLAVDREFLTNSVENDFVGTFAPEAERFLAGWPLRIDFHPPLYALTLAAARLIGGDWFSIGLLVSWIACVVVLASSYQLFRGLLGNAAGLGAVIGLGTSSVFLTYSTLAASDVYFLALYSATLYLVFRAAKHPTAIRWILAGSFIGFTVLARTNGFTLAALLLAPWVTAARRRTKVRDWLLMIVAALLPILIWFTYSKSTGSPFMPQGTAASLAWNYFGEGRSIEEVRQEFSGLMSVLTHDPALMAKKYVLDLIHLVRELLRPNQFVGPPFNLFFLAGLPVLVIQRGGRLKNLLILATLLQLLLVNLKTYESRFLLFLIPWLGAAAAMFFAAVWSRLKSVPLRLAFAIVTGFLLLGGLWQTVPEVYAILHEQDAELGEVLQAARAAGLPESSIVARNQHLPFHLGSEFVWLSGERTVDGLRARLWQLEANQRIRRWMGDAEGETLPLLFYIGSLERAVSPSSRWPFPPVIGLIDESGPPSWLERIAQGPSGPWELYRVHLPTAEGRQVGASIDLDPDETGPGIGSSVEGGWGLELRPLGAYGALFMNRPEGPLVNGEFRLTIAFSSQVKIAAGSRGTVDGTGSDDRLEINLVDQELGLKFLLVGSLDAQGDELRGDWRLLSEMPGIPRRGKWLARRLPKEENSLQRHFTPLPRE